MRVRQFALVGVATAGLASTAFADGFVAYEQAYAIGSGAPGFFSDAVAGQYWGSAGRG